MTEVTVGKFANILLIVLAVVIILTIALGYWSQLKEGVMGFLGVETEEEEIHEGNIQAEKEFQNLLKDIERCKETTEINCGCTFNTNNFNSNHLILASSKEVKIIDIGKMRKKTVVKDENAGFVLETSELEDLNCLYDKNFKKIKATPARIFFDKETPYFHRYIDFFQNKIRFNEFPINIAYPLYKKSSNEICWVSEKVQNIKECK
tara:strand:- start:2227 stop:2844 length:618 start_codon:yes stop_codon:yes gene_type:complete